MYSAPCELYCSPALWEPITELYKASLNSASSLGTIVSFISYHFVNTSSFHPRLHPKPSFSTLRDRYFDLLGDVVNPSGSPLNYPFDLFHYAVPLQLFHSIPSIPVNISFQVIHALTHSSFKYPFETPRDRYLTCQVML